MKRIELNEGKIQNLLSKYLEVKIVVPNSLFIVEPVWSAIRENRCPYCNRKLSISPTRNIVRCVSPHCVSDRKFIIRKDKYFKLRSELSTGSL